MFIKAFDIALSRVYDEQHNDIAQKAVEKFRIITPLHDTCKSRISGYSRGNEKCTMLMPTTNGLEADINVLDYGFMRSEYMFTTVHDQFPIATWQHFDNLPAAQKEVTTRVYGSCSNASRLGFHNMMKTASDNLSRRSFREKATFKCDRWKDYP